MLGCFLRRIKLGIPGTGQLDFLLSQELQLAFPLSLRVQVPNSHILTQTLYYNYSYPNPKYLTNYWVHGPYGLAVGGDMSKVRIRGLGFSASVPIA